MKEEEKEVEEEYKEKIYKKEVKRFRKPTIEELKGYCKERGNNIDPEYFYDHYESNGWTVGRNKMKDWQASIRTWERNDKNKGAEKKVSASATKDVFWKICPGCGYQTKTIRGTDQCPKCGEYGTAFKQGRGKSLPGGIK
jgi:rubrerythrin